MNLMKHINSLETPKRFQAVSFDMHCDIGIALDQDDSNHDAMEVHERTLLNTNEIDFIP